MLAKSENENELLSESSANKQKVVQFLNVLEFLLEKELNNRHLDIQCPSGLEEYPEASNLSLTKASRPK